MNNIKEIDQIGVNFLIDQEELILHPYLDSVGRATIGVGCTYYENGNPVKMTDPIISKDRAILLFKKILKLYEVGVTNFVKSIITQNQYSALVSFCYNEGIGALKSSTLLRKVNINPNDPTIKNEFLRWERAGKDPKRLESRREAEIKLYFTK